MLSASFQVQFCHLVLISMFSHLNIVTAFLSATTLDPLQHIFNRVATMTIIISWIRKIAAFGIKYKSFTMAHTALHNQTLTYYPTPSMLLSVTHPNAATPGSSNVPRSLLHLRGFVNMFSVLELLFIATCCPITIHPLDKHLATFWKRPAQSTLLKIILISQTICFLSLLFVTLFICLFTFFEWSVSHPRMSEGRDCMGTPIFFNVVFSAPPW